MRRNCLTLLVVICLSSVGNTLDVGHAPSASSCDRERKVLTGYYGTLSSGNKEYPMDSHCEWLIKAPEKDSFITLIFTKMDTECSYDHVFIYDGDSYTSPLLGSFSGNTTPPHITTTQGFMLILLYSDTNYVRNGFEAAYSVAPCPKNCSNQGVCQNHQCICDTLWTGSACENSLCPSECGSSEDRGECNMNGTAPPRCECRSGYSGADCSLPDSNKNGGNSWHMISSNEVAARASHSGTYVEHMDSFYVFGGLTFRRVLGDTLVFSFRDNQWSRIDSEASPSPRHGHAAVCYHNNLILFGGEQNGGVLSNELWFFNVSSRQWSLMTPKKPFKPPPVTKHSVTLVDFYWLYVIGGVLTDGTFSSQMFRINIRDMNGWELVDVYGDRESSRRMVGHSAVYHQQTKTIFVFGGIMAEYSHVSKLTNQLYAFHVEKKYWIKIKYERNTFTPLERAFHTAAIVGDYMVVYGGYTHKHVEEEICYDNETHLYHLRCHKWIDISSLREDFVGPSNPVSQGVFSHAMGVRRGHTLVIFGGYSGLMRSQLLAYVLPSAIFSDQLLPSPCSKHKSAKSCVSNLACGWCMGTNICVEKNTKMCSQLLDTCSGLCPALGDCFSCLIWGQSYIENVISDRQDPFPPFSCTWCIQDGKCHSADDLSSNCSSNANISLKSSTTTSSPISGSWWGSGGIDATSIEDCYLKDSPPGLISVKYRHPVNFSQPDDVLYLSQASEDILFRNEIQRADGSGHEENIVKFLGFLHPMDAKPLSKRISQLRLSICSAGSNAILKLSNDSSQSNMEVVASHGPRPSYYCSDVQRGRGGAPLFPFPSEGHRYAFDFTVRTPTHLNETASVQIKWTAFSVDFEVIDAKHLELPKNGTCYLHATCLACVTDSGCGWCEGNNNCYPRAGGPFCQRNGKASFLVTHPDQCSVCSDHIYCEHCALTSSCEWLVEAAICVRRGRFRMSVKDPMQCPIPCQARSSCVFCLGEPGMCAWCEEKRTCFLFSTYTSSYAFGKCRDWVDENRSGIGIDLCRNCSRHTQCSSCIKDLSCGWCSSPTHPASGSCTDGDFSGPLTTIHRGVASINTCGAMNYTSWSYDACPDLEECLWNMHDCHENATCINTPDSYTCECNIGFEGDGRTCVRTCPVKCINGLCSDAPDFRCLCDLGWTGEDCNTNCGCNNHSTCFNAVGVCDECHDWTQGIFCEECSPGSYGDATTSDGCKRCNCNGHGNPELGVCNITTGVCFCLNDTIGPNCEHCREGFYGDPRGNGICYEECHPRKVITNAMLGKFGSPAMSTESRDCLWLLTVHSVLDMQSLLGPMQSTGTYLQITIQPDIFIPCPHNHVYVYDGLPNFVASGHPNVLLGAFCGTNLTRPIVATASSGYMTVHFRRDAVAHHGFNATYVRLTQPKQERGCHNDCYVSYGQGKCDTVYNLCLCNKGFGSPDCSKILSSHQLYWATLYNPQLANDSSLPTATIGHTLVSMGTEKLLLFGGYSSSIGDLNDLYIFTIETNRFKKIVTEYSPPPRHFHAAASFNGSMYIFGGIGDNAPLGDFWEFTEDQVWVQLPEILIPSGVLTLAGATLIAVDEDHLLLFGGFSPAYGFFEKVMEFDTQNKQWEVVNTTGAQPLGIYGHSSVYHKTTESIYIFGGILYDLEHVAPSNHLYTFHYRSLQWFRLPADQKVNKLNTRPTARYFHVSVVTDNYMLILGGRGANSDDGAVQPFAYMISCNLWIPLTDEAVEMLGEWPQPFVGGAAAAHPGGFYFMRQGKLLHLTAPSDACLFFSNNRVGCMQQSGCSYCSYSTGNVNETVCFSQDKQLQSQCFNPREQSKFLAGVQCINEWIEKRDCHQYTSCTDCVASWPAFKTARQVCQWCSNCRTGRCVPEGSSCDDESDCNIPRKVVNDPGICPIRFCGASDCEKCSALKMCVWTRQVLRSSGFVHTLNKFPIYNWVCVMKEIQSAPSFLLESSPPLECPGICQRHEDCESCLQSPGGEGGWHQCVWSEILQVCMSPSYELLGCEDGTCGLVSRGNSSQCPIPCWQHSQSARCLSQAHCGWCAFSGRRVDGRGLCMDGGIMGPTGGICRENQVLVNGLPMPMQTLKWFQMSKGPPTWNYLTRPPENECQNGHHTCDDTHEECENTLEGFECHCKPGYKMEGKHCTPTCRQGCVNGTCIQPDVCKCNFGFVGQNCSIMCKCNGHSDCPGPDDLENCLECKNNTFGQQCQKCKPLFVGNPVNGGSCVSCNQYCYTHSDLCFGSDVLNGTTLGQGVNQSLINDLLERQVEGPIEDAICVDCRNNTEGRRCDHCTPGFFKAGDKLEDGCRPCECNGHGDTCNPLNGENCNCRNNTENDRQCAQKNMKNMLHMTPCWQLQCSKCTEYFLGAPSDGHQCYRHMYLDKEYCFDPTTQGECNRTPIPLLRGQTVFFAVQPRYMNVDIRIVVDITKGGVDFFLSAKEDAFIVDTEKPTGLHRIYVDEKYGIDLSHYETIPEFTTTMRRKRDNVDEEDFSNGTESKPTQNLRPKIGDADGLTTYIDVKKCEDFLLVRNLANRLVVTIPQEVHDLRLTRFYMILRGAKDETFGSLFFRQDQTRIDLFVFFSVFFSCFFLFLAVCVIAWKVKQAFDVRRARRLHAAEMKHMASRPFGHIMMVVEEDPTDDIFFPYSPSAQLLHASKKAGKYHIKGRDSPKGSEASPGVRALAVEPLADNVGAVATVLVQLPGGSRSLVRLALASSLIASKPHGHGFRAAMRRRTSHVNV